VKIESMKGRLYLYKEKDHRVERVVEKEETYIIYTDLEAIEVPKKKWKVFLDKDFLESEEPQPLVAVGRATGAQSSVSQVTGQMRNVLMDALKEVKSGGDLKKARFALDTVKQVVSLARLEMEAIRLDDKLEGGGRG
jgi:hypothetical protein